MDSLCSRAGAGGVLAASGSPGSFLRRLPRICNWVSGVWVSGVWVAGEWVAGETESWPTTTASWSRASRRSSSLDRKSTRLNSSHLGISYVVFCLEIRRGMFAYEAQTAQISRIHLLHTERAVC